MPEFQRKLNRCTHKGMKWNASVDNIPEGQICYGRNIRVFQDGVVVQRPGLTNYQTLASGAAYTHTISRLNNYDLDVNYGHGFLIGIDNKLYFGACGASSITPDADIKHSLTNAPQNPISTTMSGNPLSLVDMAPIGSSSGWKYIGDTTGNYAVGLYPGDNPGPTIGVKARLNGMGMYPPVVPYALLTAGGAGKLNGSYQWIFAYRNKWTGARSNPSAPTRFSLAVPKMALTNQSANIPIPAFPIDPQTSAEDLNIQMDIYRFGGTINDWRFVGTVDKTAATGMGNIFNDNLPDAAIGTSPGPPQLTDPITGVQRFNVYKPWVTQDIPHYSLVNATMNTVANGAWELQAASAVFNVGWLPGQTISINNKLWTIYQVRDSSKLEIAEDATGNMVSGTAYPWATQTTLTMGMPLAHMWGPYGTGQSGAYIFACGDPNNAGTLYWTNGNDPDSTDLANSLIVTSPSEPLRTGCVYDGTPFAWSTERQFRVYPGSVAGQFTIQEIPGSKGILAEWSLTVQSNGISDQSITWVGKDGLYDWSTMGGLRTMTDRDLAPFFPHDNQTGTQLSVLFPFLSEPVAVGQPDYSAANMKYHRLTWFHNELFYDFAAAGGLFQTLVYDAKECQGWVSLDQYQNTAGGGISIRPIGRGIEIADNNLKVGVGGEIMNYTGIVDGGNTIACRFVTRQDDLGDARVQKLYGDYMLDAQVGSLAAIVITPLVDQGNTALTTQSFPTGSRQQKIFATIPSGLGVLSTSFGFDFTWNAALFFTYLYQYEYTYVPKPEITSLRATDKTDDGYLGAKYLRGLCIECNTFGNPRTVHVLVDDVSVGTLTVNSASQLELPFAITPIVGSEFQAQPTDGTALWELFSIRWVWEKWPDLDQIQSNWMNLGTSKAKYIRAFTMPISGPASPTLSFVATYDGSNTYTTTAVAPANIAAKSPAEFSFNPPILAHQIKLTPSVPCRCWYEEIVWDAEEWPELATLYGPWTNLNNTSGSKYIRGINIPMETNGAAITMSLLYDKYSTPTTGIEGTETFGAVTTDPLVKVVFPFTPAVPIIAHEFQLRSNGNARFWYNEIDWEFEPWPEFDTGRMAFGDAGTPGAKFMQGAVMVLDTGGQPVTIDLVYEGGTVPLGPFTTPAGVKQAIPFSFPTPFICHEFQLIPRTACRIFDKETKWVWEPVPELVTTYTTQETDLDLPGYHYQFDAYIAYIGSSDAPNLAIKTEYGTVNYTLPVSNGVFNRAYVLLQPQKAKWRSFSITSTNGIRLFLKDCEVRAKAWTDKGNYPAAFQSHHPFGDESRRIGAAI